MRIALVASPFISVPPSHYGGTELFIAQLAEGLTAEGVDVVVYGNGESKVKAEVRYLYEAGDWPIEGELYGNLKDMNHTAWAVHDAWGDADVIHLNNVPGLTFSRFAGPKFVYTVHHPHRDEISSFYSHYPDVQYVCISEFQKHSERMPNLRTIHHGVDMSAYRLQREKGEYLSFLGRIAPLKGTHLAIEVAKKAGIPLKIAGEVQPLFQDYFETQIKPHLDGKFIEYVGSANLEEKNELLGNSLAMLFPIQWDEPFGLVVVEAMATGTPVLAFPGGAVPEIVQDGVSGRICTTVEEMSQYASRVAGAFSPERVRAYVEEHFSVQRMVRDYTELYREIVPVQERLAKATVAMPAQFISGGSISEETIDPEEPQAVA